MCVVRATYHHYIQVKYPGKEGMKLVLQAYNQAIQTIHMCACGISISQTEHVRQWKKHPHLLVRHNTGIEEGNHSALGRLPVLLVRLAKQEERDHGILARQVRQLPDGELIALGRVPAQHESAALIFLNINSLPSCRVRLSVCTARVYFGGAPHEMNLHCNSISHLFLPLYKFDVLYL